MGFMQKPATETHNPRVYMLPKEGAYMAGISVESLYARLRGPNPPPHKKRGRRYLLPRVEFTEWAMQDVIE